MREYVKRESNRSIKDDINKMKWLTGFFNVFSRLREIIIFRVTIKCRVYAILRFFFFFFFLNVSNVPAGRRWNFSLETFFARN